MVAANESGYHHPHWTSSSSHTAATRPARLSQELDRPQGAGHYQYTAFGQVSTTGTAPNPFTYIGAPTDQSDRLTYLNARYLDSTTGTFISEDPIPAPALYPYALDDPAVLSTRADATPSPKRARRRTSQATLMQTPTRQSCRRHHTSRVRRK
jgi:RHS repeat-associated protein